MGYDTEFNGEFTINKPVNNETYKLLKGLQETRRLARNVNAKYGIEGEFYVTDDNKGVKEINRPPKTQPGLWCQWEIQEDRQTIEWDGGEKFYFYIEWLEYIISKILAPQGYVLNGEVEYRGEEFGDQGIISVVDNKVNGKALPSNKDIIDLLNENKRLKEETKRLKKEEQKKKELERALKD